MTTPRLRFAPSPTGYLHVGNVRTALINVLFAKKAGGTFFLRMDDTDTERSRPEFEAAIIEDMQWLGLGYEGEPVRQCERFDRYDEAKQKLVDAGRLYPCYETAEELDFKRKMLSGRGKPPIYDRAALSLTDEQKAAYEAEGKQPHWRFKLDDDAIVWNDMVRGECSLQATHMSDPVLIRADGVPLYTLSSVVDDIDMDITHIVRGEDHVSNSAVQIQIFEALGGKVPSFAHMALLTTKDGKLSKREGGGDIRSLREQGIAPEAINSLLGMIGTSHAVELKPSLDALAENFDFSTFSRSAAQYDEDELHRLNTKLLHVMSLAEAAEKTGLALTEPFWHAVRENIESIDDVAEWWAMVHEPLTPQIDDAEYCTKAATLLPDGEWDADSWKHFTDAVKQATGRKGKELFMPLRLALTGRSNGPDLPTMFQLLGREKVEQRLNGKAA